MSPDQPLWTPTPERIAAANVTAFRLAAERRWGVALPDYEALLQKLDSRDARDEQLAREGHDGRR